VWIAHELTVHTRGFLLRGVIDAIINQDAGHEARSAARVLLAHCWGDPILADQERINIDISCAITCRRRRAACAVDLGGREHAARARSQDVTGAAWPRFASGPRPHGWFYDERRTPAINDCLTAAAGKQKRQ
jgi:hypothetical protein